MFAKCLWLLSVLIISGGVSALPQQTASSVEDLDGVVVIRNVDYIAGADYAADRDKLDIFMPEGADEAPVIVFYHGGALMQGDKVAGEALARRFVPEGIGVVSATYRLSPGVMHPAHIQDATAAFAWVVSNIARYGGDPDRVYVSGHSAGAYLAALMALDPSYLAAHGLAHNTIRGTIPISPFLYVEETAKDRPKTVWGEDPEAWLEASVTPHVGTNKGPMLLIYADGDDKWRRDQIDIFGEAMRAAGNRRVRVVEMPDRTHGSLMTSMNAPDDRIGDQVMEFVKMYKVDHFLPSRPETLNWGWYPIDRKPVLTIQSGETVRINTLTHVGAVQKEDPVTFLTGLGVPRDEILDDVLDFWASREGRPREGRSGHVITGPIYIDGAERGDMLEIQILDIETRVSWGANSTRAQGGVFSTSYPGARADDPQLEMSPMRHLIRTGKANGREVAFFSDDIHVPLAPFMGILAVAPDPVVGEPGVMVPGVQGSRPPGAFGGNLDVKDLKAGTTVYLPVFHPGALFYAGDPHGAQGDGEVSGTAIEQSLSGVFRFIVHKGKTISGPRAETDTHYLIMGIDLDLNRATRRATWEVVDFLVHEKGLTQAKALSLASIAVDFRVSEVVDLTQVVTGFIPKDIFLR